MRDIDANVRTGRRQENVAVDRPERAKNDNAETTAQADDAFILGRVEMAVRHHVGTRLDGVEQAVAGVVVGRMEIAVPAPARRLLRLGADFGEQRLVDHHDH